MTTTDHVVLYNQENSKADDKTGAYSLGERERVLLMAVRQGLLLIAGAIEKYLGLERKP